MGDTFALSQNYIFKMLSNIIFDKHSRILKGHILEWQIQGQNDP